VFFFVFGICRGLVDRMHVLQAELADFEGFQVK